MPRPSPAILDVDAAHADDDVALTNLIEDIRNQADAFVFLVGGAGRTPKAVQRRVVSLLDAIAMLARRGRRIAMADGGTRAGVMEAAGLAREASGNRFPLIGICPAMSITATREAGKAPVDPNHSHIVAVRDHEWEAARRVEGWTPTDGYWGSETRTMHRIFARLAEGCPSLTLVVNGGDIVLDEIRENVKVVRPMVLFANSGRAADALIALVHGTEPFDAEVRRLRDKGAGMGLPGPIALYRLFDLSGEAEDLATLLDTMLS